MSGGSYNYFCFKMEDIEIERQDIDARRAAFQELFDLAALAMHDIEWVDSGDKVPGDEHKAIDKCFEFTKADPKTIYKAAAYDKLKDFFEINSGLETK